jgi:hypothetical protein
MRRSVTIFSALLFATAAQNQQLPSPRYKSILLQGEITTATSAPNQFFAENGAPVQRLGGRVFMGGAVKHTGTNAGAQPDWLTRYLASHGRVFGFQHVTQAAVLTNEQALSANALLAGAQTKFLGVSGNAIGVVGVAVGNYGKEPRGAFGGYFEGFKDAAALGTAVAAEVDIINFDDIVTIDTFAQQPEQTIGLQIASAAEFKTANPASAAINIRNNGASFVKGLVIGNDAIAGADGVNGVAPAIEMATGHTIDWYAGAGSRAWALYAAPGVNGDFNFVSSGSGALVVPKIKETVGTPWTSYKPAVTAISGKFGSVSAAGRYREEGKTVHFTAKITVTRNGTAAKGIKMTLPMSVGGGLDFSFSCDERAIEGVMCRASVASEADTVQIVRFDGAYLGSDGASIVVSGTFEKT